MTPDSKPEKVVLRSDLIGLSLVIIPIKGRSSRRINDNTEEGIGAHLSSAVYNISVCSFSSEVYKISNAYHMD